MSGYENMLEKYRDVDEDEIMSGLTEDELAQLENEIDREILEKPPEAGDSGASDSYTTTDDSEESEESQSEDEEPEEYPDIHEQEKEFIEHHPKVSTIKNPPTKDQSSAFTRGKLDRTQLKHVPKNQLPQKKEGKHTFKLPTLKKTQTNVKEDAKNGSTEKNAELKNELIQAVQKRDKRRYRRGNSGIGNVRRLSSHGVPKARRNSKIVRYRDGNENVINAAQVNTNVIAQEMKNLRPKLRKVALKEPKLVLPEELHGVSFKRITAGVKKLQEEDEADPEAVNSEDGDASRNSAFGGYDADNDVTPSLSDESCAVINEDCYSEFEKERQKAMSECSEAPSDGVMTMASTASTSAESCDVFGELSINPNSVEEMVERVRENDPTLSEVNLNNIHDVPMELFEELAEAMETNTQVTSLMLANTGLTDRAARAMATMLKKNMTLKKLNLESNFITGEGARRLVASLRKNNSLIELLLDNQRHIFGAKVEFEIAKYLKENKSLLKFGYQFTNPGPRMTTSNLLTKNLDLVRKKRVAEEKKRGQPGQPKRPQLRRQPSSEWYRKERLEKLKKLQEQSKLLGLDLTGNIGDSEVEKVLTNMKPEEISVLERWFTTKLLGAVDGPPDVNRKAKQDENKASKNTSVEKKKESTTHKKENTDSSNNNLLKPPPRNKRSKSPVASRGDLMNSIRNQDPSARLKKVQVRPFESPTFMSQQDSDSEIKLPKDIPARKPDINTTTSPVVENEERNQGQGKHALVNVQSDSAEVGSQAVHKVVEDGNSMTEGTEKIRTLKPKSEKTAEEKCTHESDNAAKSDTSSSSGIKEWKEGEEYDSDEYEIVEVEVTDSEEEDDPQTESQNVKSLKEDKIAISPVKEVPTYQPESRESESSSPQHRSSLSARLARFRPEPFTKNMPEPKLNSAYEAVLSNTYSPKPEVYGYLDEKRKNQSGSRKSNPGTPLSSTSPRLTPRSPLSPRISSSPLAQTKLYSAPDFNRSVSSDSNVSSDSSSSRLGNRPNTRTYNRYRRSDHNPSPEDEVKICPKALSTIESFFNIGGKKF